MEIQILGWSIIQIDLARERAARVQCSELDASTEMDANPLRPRPACS